MRRGWGIALAGLLVGCAAGVAANHVVEFPARAWAGPTYDYKVIHKYDLIKTVTEKNPVFAKAADRDALEEGMRGFGRAGWRFVTCNDMYNGNCRELVFERVASAGQ